MDDLISPKALFSNVAVEDPRNIGLQVDRVRQIEGINLFDDIPVAILILNPQRQIVYLNLKARSLLPDLSKDPLGQRPGEALACLNVRENECGVGRYCRFCGAAQSIYTALSGAISSQECFITRIGSQKKEQLNLLVWAKPLPLEGQTYILTAMMDITAEKRRETFERIFLHDIMNTASSISSLLQLVNKEDENFEEYLDLAQVAAEQLTDEILSHRLLGEAEKGLLILQSAEVFPGELMTALTATYKHASQSRGLTIRVNPCPNIIIKTDPTILKRVLSNLLKNAIEASSRGECIEFTCASLPEKTVELRVKNTSLLSEEARAHIFKRSFSTKGKGRGLGTYAARLFVEDYLGGTITYKSTEEDGTVFSIILPHETPLPANAVSRP